jgi:nitrite reductase (cytochrome c-552)
LYAVTDARATLRTSAASPAVCWTCKSPDVPRMMAKLGGPAEFYKKKWVELGAEVTHPIGCQDCHDPATMELKITRPALIEAFARRGKDITRATHQEMRTLVCAQCHVEYYFKKDGNYLVFPWDKGTAAEEIESYYDAYEFSDWTHTASRAPMLKAQHPDYELFLTGVHAQRNVACADCHMPYRSEGGVKFTDHHVRSPLATIANSCQVCHRESEETLRSNVYARQDKIEELKQLAQAALVRAHKEAKEAWDRGAKDEAMRPILALVRHAQWRWDFVAASNGVGFHSPLECARVLGTSIQKAEEARLAFARLLASLGVLTEVAPFDVSAKTNAQAAIGLDMEKVRAEKQELLKAVAEWDKGMAPAAAK